MIIAVALPSLVLLQCPVPWRVLGETKKSRRDQGCQQAGTRTNMHSIFYTSLFSRSSSSCCEFSILRRLRLPVCWATFHRFICIISELNYKYLLVLGDRYIIKVHTVIILSEKWIQFRLSLTRSSSFSSLRLTWVLRRNSNWQMRTDSLSCMYVRILKNYLTISNPSVDYCMMSFKDHCLKSVMTIQDFHEIKVSLQYFRFFLNEFPGRARKVTRSSLTKRRSI